MNRSRGFTLAELAVALVIIGLLLASALIPFSTQIEVRNAADTRRTLDQIKEAVMGFAQANGRLPCPARGQTASGSIDSVTWAPAQIAAGTEQYDTTNKRCYVVVGVVPWPTLGVPETDAWGRRFSYRVSPAFADDPSLTTWQSRSTAYTVPVPPPTYLAQPVTTPASPANQTPSCDLTTAPSQSTIALCTFGDIAVLTRSYSDHSVVTPLGAGVPAVFVSHGKNGFGAFQSNGQPLTSSAGADELANSSGTAQATPTGGYLSNAYYSR
ncbi:MAG: hypothetical protein A2W04_07075, partial [Betaproteobacteria bacterium RBG_16_64_9]